MAAAEARAAWQRAANRCFVQEDAKRAPKLAHCPSPMQQHESVGEKAPNSQEPVYNFAPLNWNPMGVPGLPPDTKWWLQVQPNTRYRDDLIQKVLHSDGCSCDRKVEKVNSAELSSEQLLSESFSIDPKTNEATFQSPQMISTTGMKRADAGGREFVPLTNNPQEPLKSIGGAVDIFHQNEQQNSKKSSSEMTAPWEEGETKKPWWRIADESELALLVSQKAKEHFVNCDLPKPTQTVHISNTPVGLGESNCEELFASSFSQDFYRGVCDGMPSNYSSDERSWSNVGYEASSDKDMPYSTGDHVSRGETLPARRPSLEDNSGRSQLLEALRHSQTRAREAELAAKRALDEKEHIVKLLFRQASHLFAYKQWIKILQLENLCLQLRIKDHQIETLIPSLPWLPLKDKPPDSDQACNSSKKGKAKPRKSGVCNAVIFAIGLGITGAGLILGWTLGWLLPKL